MSTTTYTLHVVQGEQPGTGPELSYEEQMAADAAAYEARLAEQGVAEGGQK